MNASTLAELAIGGRAKITGFTLESGTRQRLMEMGLTKGAECQMVRFAPLGDPLEIKVRGYHLSLRKSEAQGIQVQTL